MKKSYFLLFVFLCTFNITIAQKTIYVDASNNTGYQNGTQENPYSSVKKALLASQNGYSISIAKGVYNEDTLLIDKCVSVNGKGHSATIVNGTFILSFKLDTLPVLVRNLWCRNVMHSDSGYTKTPLTIMECGLQVLNNYTPSVSETGRILLKNCIVEDSIYIQSASCSAKREVINCESGGGLWVSSTSSQGLIRLEGNKVAGNLDVRTTAKSDTIFIQNNTVSGSLNVLSTASDPDVISDNTIGNGVRLKAVAHNGFLFSGNHVQNGSLSATYTALSESIIGNNVFSNGGINFKATSGAIAIKENEIQTDGSVAGIKFKTTAGGYLEDNTITLPYFEPSGLPFEDDTASVCCINVRSVAFGGMKGNRISGGAYGVYLSAIASNEFDRNGIEYSHIGLYLKSVSGDVDSNRVENCRGDGMILDYQPERADTNSIRLNYNIIQNNGGHGIRTRGNCPMGKLDVPGTGFNIIKNNGGYDLYVETLTSFVDTIWAQNNEWTHSTEEEIGRWDVFDKNDDHTRAIVIFSPIMSTGVKEITINELVVYPNPTYGNFQISDFKFQNKKYQVEILNLNGRVLENFELTTETGNPEFDIGHLKPGVYFVRLYNHNQTVIGKVVKR
jgi:hypothetical protein